MLTLLFTICMIWFIGKFFIFGLKASWGILKLLCTVVFFPVINRNGGRRFGLYRISATAHWWDYWTYRIEIINQMKEIRAYV